MTADVCPHARCAYNAFMTIGSCYDCGAKFSDGEWHDQPAPPNKVSSVGMLFEFIGILKGIRGALDTANGLVIVDTLWYSNAETLRDFISKEIERYEKAMLEPPPADPVSATPRTDALVPHLNLSHMDLRSAAYNLHEHARDLERELSEAKLLEAKYKETIGHFYDKAESAEARAAELQKERDHAHNAAIDKCKNELSCFTQSTHELLCKKLDALKVPR